MTILVELMESYMEMGATVLFCIGFSTLLFHQNLIKKILGFNIMDTAIFLFLAAKGYIAGRPAPILSAGVYDPSHYGNPLPSGLVLTGIVVSVSATAFALGLVLKLYEKYETLNIDEIIFLSRGEK